MTRYSSSQTISLYCCVPPAIGPISYYVSSFGQMREPDPVVPNNYQARSLHLMRKVTGLHLVYLELIDSNLQAELVSICSSSNYLIAADQ